MSNINDAILAIRKRSMEAPQNEEVIPTAGVPAEEVAEEIQEELPPTNAIPEQEVVNVVQEEIKPRSWDDDDSEPVVVKAEQPSFDFSKMGSALELGEIKNQEEFVTRVSEIKSKLKLLEEAPLSGLPDDAKEVIKVMQSGGDWRDYLSQGVLDYTKIDPVQLFEDTFLESAVKNPKYYTEGKFDQAKAEEALEAISEPIRGYEGHKIATAINDRQKQKQADHRAQAEQKIARADETLSKSTKNLQELLPVENFGIKFEPKHSSEIFKGIADSTLTKKYLGVTYEALVAQGADMKDIAATITARHYLEKMMKAQGQQGKIEAKKELLNKTQFAQIKNTGSVIKPEDTETKVKSTQELIKQHRESMKRGL